MYCSTTSCQIDNLFYIYYSVLLLKNKIEWKKNKKNQCQERILLSVKGGFLYLLINDFDQYVFYVFFSSIIRKSMEEKEISVFLMSYTVVHTFQGKNLIIHRTVFDRKIYLCAYQTCLLGNVFLLEFRDLKWPQTFWTSILMT